MPIDASAVVLIHDASCPHGLLAHISKKYPRLVLICVSAGGLAGGSRGGSYWSVGRPVGKPTDDAFGERLQEFLRSYEEHGKPEFRKLEPDIEPVLALRILCEAWKVPGGELNGITIHAPQNRDQWLDPFRKDDQSLPLAKEFASLMGDAEIGAKATAVIEAASDADKLPGAVGAFLAATKATIKNASEQKPTQAQS